MQIYKNAGFSIYFGDASDCFFPDQYKSFCGSDGEFHPFNAVRHALSIERPLFLHQVHGAQGVILSSDIDARNMRLFSQEGDFLITNLSGVGIGVLTADCLPIILYDPEKRVAAVLHAGWRSSVQKIGEQALGVMQERFDSDLQKIRAIFGPCAHACCYQVKKGFLDHLEPFSFASHMIAWRPEGLFFDLVQFNRQLLLQAGLSAEHIDLTPGSCTMCNHSYYSHRRQGVAAGRNISVVKIEEL